MRSEDIFQALFCDDSLQQLPILLSKLSNSNYSVINWSFNDKQSTDLVYHGYDHDFMNKYAEYWVNHDPWFNATNKKYTVNKIIIVQEYVSEIDFSRSAMYNDFILRNGYDTFYCAGMTALISDGAGFISLNRSRTDAAFEKSDLAAIAPRANDLVNMFKLRGDLASARKRSQLSKSALDGLALAIFIVQADGRCVHMNESAEVLGCRGDGAGDLAQ